MAALFLVPSVSFAAQVTITINDSTFSPRNVTVNPGDTVTWVNTGTIAHTVTSDNGGFDSGTISVGQSFTALFNTAGNYGYRCNFHGGVGGVGQSGTITVASANAPVPSVPASSPSVAELQAQAQALIARVAALQAQLGVSSGGVVAPVVVPVAGVTDSSSCPLVGRSLKRGVSGEDVTRLQQFLARDPAIYPEATVSGYYGALTERAVQRWQVKYNIVSSGSPETTGFGVVGPRTAAAIALLCTTGSYGGIPGPAAAPQVGGFITVSPISGEAPLEVAVVATINTTKSCSAAVYTLDFGDGTAAQQIPVSAGNCKEFNQPFEHTYRYGGKYVIKLSAAGHDTSATVTVAGPPPPVFTPGLPRESFTVTPITGTAPLTVTFSGTVNSNDAGFCLGGCASTLDFGDGTAASINLPASVGGWLNYGVSHTYTQSGGFRATLYQGGAGPLQPTVGSITIIILPSSPGTGTSTPAGSYSYSVPTIVSSDSASLTFSTTFDLPTSCTGYRLSWGDGTADVIQNDGATSCAQTPAQKTLTHQYVRNGSYTITLKRGANLSRIDDIALTISN